MKKLLGLMIAMGCGAQDTSKLDDHITKIQNAFVVMFNDNSKAFSVKQEEFNGVMNVWVLTRNNTARVNGKMGKIERQQWEDVVKKMEALDEEGRKWGLIMEKFGMLKEAIRGEE